MYSFIEQSIYRSIGIECDQTPDEPIDVVWKNCKKQLEKNGISEKLLQEFEEIPDFLMNFSHRLIPNPVFWQHHTNAKICFFFVRSQSRQYHDLLELLKTNLPGIAYFICYGEFDAIIQIIGDDSGIQLISSWLSENGFFPDSLEVDDVVLYYDKKIPPKFREFNTTLSLEEIESRFKQIGNLEYKQKIQDLINEGISLGYAYLEDAHQTGRIRALIGIKLDGLPKPRDKRVIERSLIDVNDDEMELNGSRPISSIYHCKGVYGYIIECIFQDQAQLHKVTDLIQKVDPLIQDTETFILAKAEYPNKTFSEQNQGSLGEYFVVKNIVDTQLRPLASDLLEKFPEIDTHFKSSNPMKRFTVITLFNDLTNRTDFNIYKNESVRNCIGEFLVGVLEENSTRIQNSGFSVIRDVVEKKHQDFFGVIIEKFFGNDGGRFQKALKTDNSLWEKWGLGKFATHVYPKWNSDKVYSSVFQMSEKTLNDLGQLGYLRNRFAHDNVADVSNLLISKVTEAFRYSFDVIDWLDQTLPKIQNPTIPVSVIELIKNARYEDSFTELLSMVEVNQRYTNEIINTISAKSDDRYREISNTLANMTQSIEKIDINTIQIIEELVIPVINEKNKPQFKKAMDYLKGNWQFYTADLAINLLASVIWLFLSGV